jgi:uncharacterized protein (TIGR00369 family)
MRITVQEFEDFLVEQFPQGARYGTLERLGDGWADMKLKVRDEHLRPGGTVSGPALMALADLALYAALLSQIGLVPLAVTSNLNINFLRKPVANCSVIASARMLRVGKAMGVGEVNLRSEGNDALVAHATISYSIPAER